MNRIRSYFFQPLNNAPLVVWRIAFGLLMFLESWGAIATGWVYQNLVAPEFTFSFIGFEWLQPLPGYGMYGYYVLMGLAALGVASGWRYRWSALLLAVLWSGCYFMQKTSYNNHYYLAVLLCWLMVLLPADARFSIQTRKPANSFPRWIAFLAKAMLLIVFTYGSVAKFYPGWLNGDFIAQSFGRKAHFWGIGPLLQLEGFQAFITYGAIVFDGLVIPLLWYKPTRKLAFWGLVAFNLFNSAVFHIGIFPYLVLAFTVFFFEPVEVESFFRVPRQEKAAELEKPNVFQQQFVVGLLALFLVWQAALPLRHHLIPGDVNWREEGHRLSWRMMLRSKSGTVVLNAVNPKTKERERVNLREHLSPKQIRAVATKPDFFYRFMQELRKHYEQKGWPGLEVYVVRSRVYLNGTKQGALYPQDVNLADVSWNYWGRNEWVLDYQP